MMSADDLRAAIETSFETTGRGVAPWPDPHPDRSPADEEYSRVTDAGRYLIVGARADAWIAVLVGTGLAVLETDAPVEWRDGPRPYLGRVDRLVPARPGALALVIARGRIGDVDEAGVTIGVGDPAVLVGIVPDCGCDACDSGSNDLLEQLDGYLLAVVTGAFRRLTSRDREITQLLDGQVAASSRRRMSRARIDSVLVRPPRGWTEVTGAAWWTATAT